MLEWKPRCREEAGGRWCPSLATPGWSRPQRSGCGRAGLCRALKGTEGVQDARLDFSRTDCPAILVHVDSVDVMNRVLFAPAVSAAHFAVGDLAHHTRTETRYDAATSQAMYDAGH